MTNWIKSSFCADRACVEVARLESDNIAVRDSKNLDQPALQFSTGEWSAFLDAVVGGTLFSAER